MSLQDEMGMPTELAQLRKTLLRMVHAIDTGDLAIKDKFKIEAGGVIQGIIEIEAWIDVPGEGPRHHEYELHEISEGISRISGGPR